MKKYEMVDDELFADFARSLDQRLDQDNKEIAEIRKIEAKIKKKEVKIKKKWEKEIENLEKKLGYRVRDLIGHKLEIIDSYNRLMKFMKTDEYKKYKE